MWHLLYTVLFEYIRECIDARRQSTVQTEDLLLDQRRQWKVIEEVGEVLPHIRITVLAETLVVEAVPRGRQGDTQRT
jgi:hypothetical protein